MRFTRMIAAITLVGTVAGLCGCKQTATPNVPPTASASASEGPAAKPGITLSNVRINLPPVSGNPAALYFTIANSSNARATLVAINVEGAEKADMHETVGGAMKPLVSVPVDPGAIVEFRPGGKHVMVYGLGNKARLGKAPEVTLTFADGDKISGKAFLQAAASGGGMSGMKM